MKVFEDANKFQIYPDFSAEHYGIYLKPLEYLIIV